jgi:hypothetical protein
MRLYERWAEDRIVEVVADSHIEEFEFYLAARKAYGVEIEPGTIKQLWETTILNKRERHESKQIYAYPITIGKVK